MQYKKKGGTYKQVQTSIKAGYFYFNCIDSQSLHKDLSSGDNAACRIKYSAAY